VQAVEGGDTALGQPASQEHQAGAAVGEQRLIALRDAGVRIENHGWSHVEISSLTDAAFAEHVITGREWLRREASVEARLYAVPFGATDVPVHLREWVPDGYFLASALARLRAYLHAKSARDPGTGA
jgi:peptidoglycan/xylan/chitin deacetylase (PgdA/CDA1 family)